MRPEDAETAILSTEREALTRWSAGDPVGYVESAAEDITYFDDIGAQLRVEGRVAVRAYLSTLEGQIPKHAFEMVSPRVQVYGDIGVVTLRYHSSIGGDPGPPWKATTVYRHLQGEWRMVHAHWSLVKETE
jgi:ketosteroid isomerase-like protein